MREFPEGLLQGIHGGDKTGSQTGKVGLIFDFEHETDGEDCFACSRRAVHDGYAFFLGTAVFNVFMLLLEPPVNRLNRFVLIRRERFEGGELKQVSVLELFDGVNCIVFFA